VDRLRDRLMVDHPDMPTFHFRGEDARALRLYLRPSKHHEQGCAAIRHFGVIARQRPRS
jgi:hypothetical protein